MARGACYEAPSSGSKGCVWPGPYAPEAAYQVVIDQTVVWSWGSQLLPPPLGQACHCSPPGAPLRLSRRPGSRAGIQTEQCMELHFKLLATTEVNQRPTPATPLHFPPARPPGLSLPFQFLSITWSYPHCFHHLAVWCPELCTLPASCEQPVMVATTVLVNGSGERLECDAVTLADLQQQFTERFLHSALSFLLHKKAYIVEDSCQLYHLLGSLSHDLCSNRLFVSPSGWGTGAAPESIQLCVPEHDQLQDGVRVLSLLDAPEDVVPATLYDCDKPSHLSVRLFGAIWEQEHMKVEVIVPGTAGDSKLEIPITPYTTGAGLKGAIQAQTGIPRGEQALYVSRHAACGSRRVHCKDRKLADQGIYPGSELRALHIKPGTNKITVLAKMLTGKTIKLDCYLSSLVEEVKRMIHTLEGIPPDQQRFIYSGRQLEDGRSLQDYGFKDGAMMHLVLRLGAGMYHETSGRLDLLQLAPQQEVEFVLPDGSSLTLACPPTATIGEVKRLLVRALEQRSREEAVAAALADPDSTDDVAVLREALRAAQAQLGGQTVEAPQRSNRRRQRTPKAALR